VVFEDVSLEAWFAPYIAKVAKVGIVSGYRDASGNPTGKYGASDNVTVAQLLKIVHKMGGIDETEARANVQNIQARGQWYEKYVASAEEKTWQIVWDRREDLNRHATRAEVVATILQVLRVPRIWPTGKRFADVQATTKYAASIETAAEDGLISGYTTRDGNSTGEFGPNDPINRAEIAKIISLAIDLYIEKTPEFTGESR